MHDRTLRSRYALEAEIGRGGMGVVYRAHDLKYDRPVAVKFLNADATSLVGAERFADEIRTTARLRHQNILQVDDSDEVDGELFYVMPYVEGPSLRERLERGPRIGVLEALRIARQIASALAYAHSHGIIHRDIKPDNVLLGQDGHVYVADFGLAHVLARSENQHLTAAGLALGTPAYMSPEQATSEPLDGRSDIYSLGCVLFEALAGEPPFAGTNPGTTLRRQIVEAAPSLRRRRADVTPGVDRLVACLLEKNPDNRFPSAEAFAEALDVEIARLSASAITAEPEATTRTAVTRRWLIAGAALVALATSVWWAVSAATSSVARLDADRWLLLPLQWQSEVTDEVRVAEDAQLRDAFSRWTDLDLVPRPTIEQSVAPEDLATGIPEREAVTLAGTFGAGRVLQGIATLVGDSIHLDLRASSADDGALLGRVSARVPRDAPRAQAYAIIVDSLLFGRTTWDGVHTMRGGTTSSAAWAEYVEGRKRLARWDVLNAESAFVRAAQADPGFGRARFWIAQLAAVRGSAFDGHLNAAIADTLTLTPRERLLADALAALSNKEHPRACEAYARQASLDPQDFFAWYGMGECRARDELVVVDASSPTGWRFRGSWATAMDAYEHAFALAPGSHVLFREGGFERLRHLLMTKGSQSWRGRSADGSGFTGKLEVYGDTLALIARPWDGGPVPPSNRDRADDALRRQRLRFQRIAEGWADAYPQSADALHALALAQDILADPTALETLSRARTHATSEGSRRDLAFRAVWTGIKFRAYDPAELHKIRLLADSLLDTHPSNAGPDDDERAVALALLLGRPTRAAALARRAQPTVSIHNDVSAPVLRPAAALLAFATAGVPTESIASIEAELLRALPQALIDDQRRRAVYELERAAMLAAPVMPMRVLENGDQLAALTARAWSALHRGEVRVARRIADDLKRRFPEGVPPGGRTPDLLFSEAALHAALSDTVAAISWLDPTLTQLEWIQPAVLDDFAHTGALVRAMALRAELAHALGDTAATDRFASVVEELWSDGEPSTQPVVDHMRALRTRRSAPR